MSDGGARRRAASGRGQERGRVPVGLLLLLTAGVATADPPTPVPVSQDRSVRLGTFLGGVLDEVVAPDFTPFSAALGPLDPAVELGFPPSGYEMEATQTSSLPSQGASGDLFARSFAPEGTFEDPMSPSTSSFEYVFDVNESGGYDLEMGLVKQAYTVQTPGGDVTALGTGQILLERLSPDAAVLLDRTSHCAQGCRETGPLPEGRYRLSAIAEVPHLPWGGAGEDLERSVRATFVLSLTDPPSPPAVPALQHAGRLLLALLLIAAAALESGSRGSRTISRHRAGEGNGPRTHGSQ